MELAIIILLLCIISFPVLLLRKNLPERLPDTVRSLNIDVQIQRYSPILILLFSLLMVISIFGRVAAAKWNVIDDHEIMLFLGPDLKLPPREIISTFTLTEVGNFGSFDRFRPTYYFLRILESVLWGPIPLYWHVARLVLLWLSISLTWLLIWAHLGWLGGGAMCAYILTFAFWPETIGRLGAGETYAVLGLPLYAWGMVVAVRKDINRKGQILAGISLFIGALICMGSKENFLLLVIPSAYLTIKALRNHKYILFLFAFGSVIFALFVGAAAYLLISLFGTDMYANSITPFSRLSALFKAFLWGDNLLSITLLMGLILFLSMAFFSPRIPSEARRNILKFLFWFIVLLTIFFSQLIFYNGAWPVGNRYDFPGILYLPAAIYILYLMAEEIAIKGSRTLLPNYAVRAVFTLVLCLMVLMKGYKNTTIMLNEIVTSSNHFTNNLSQISSVLKYHPDSVVVFESQKVRDYEPVFSYERFLRANGVVNPLFLRIHCYSLDTVPAGLAQSLATKLHEISIQGDDNFLPIYRLVEYQDRCYSLDLSSSTLTECSRLGTESIDCK